MIHFMKRTLSRVNINFKRPDYYNVIDGTITLVALSTVYMMVFDVFETDSSTSTSTSSSNQENINKDKK